MVARTVIWLCAIPFLALADRSERTAYKIYENVEAFHSCFRRLNGTHQIGCSSSLSGNVGVIHIVSNDSAVQYVIKDGRHPPYIPVISFQDLRFLRQFRDSGRVKGVLVIKTEDDIEEGFSMDQNCPNRQSGFYKPSSSLYCKDWNKPGTGIMHEDWGFPILYLSNSKEIEEINRCYENFNLGKSGNPPDWPLCAAELKTFMPAAVDTPTCLRRSRKFSISPSSVLCESLGDYNIWTSLQSTRQSEPHANKSVMIIAARFDTGVFFDQVAPGAGSTATGISTLLLTLMHLAQIKNKLNINKQEISHVYFILFNGEASDYIGSSRIAYDMNRKEFPVPLNSEEPNVWPALLEMHHVKYYLEIGQVGSFQSNLQTPLFYIHDNANEELEPLVESLIRNSEKSNVTTAKANSNMGIPPSSLHSFLKHSSKFPGLLFTNHEKSFTNKYYHSLYDNAQNLKYDHNVTDKADDRLSIQYIVAETAKLLATVTAEMMGFNDSKIESNVEMANEILYCYLESADCDLFRNLTGASTLPKEPYNLYVGVYGHVHPISKITRLAISRFQGDVSNENSKEDCEGRNKNDVVTTYIWINGQCFETTAQFSDAQSPAFIIEDYDWSSNEYSTWSESYWSTDFSVRIFLKPSPLHEYLTFGFGLAVLLISFVITRCIYRRIDIIFPKETRLARE